MNPVALLPPPKPDVRLPSAALKGIVHHYEYFSAGKEYPPNSALLLMPSFDSGLIFNFSADKQVHVKSKYFEAYPMPPDCFYPTVSVPAYNTNIRDSRGIRVIFYPGVMANIYNTSLKPLNNSIIESRYALDKELYFLHEHLQEIDSFDNQVKAIEKYLQRKLAAMDSRKPSNPAENSLFIPLSRFFEERGYQVKADEIAKEFGWVSRNFNRHLNREIGFSFDTFRRVHRFARILKCLQVNPGVRLTELAYQFEYTDQAHFIKDFKRMTDHTPGELLKTIKKGMGLLEVTKSQYDYEGNMFYDA